MLLGMLIFEFEFSIVFNNLFFKIYIDATLSHNMRHISSDSSSQCDWAYFSINYHSKSVQNYCYQERCNTFDYAQNLISLKCEQNYSYRNLKLEYKFGSDYSAKKSVKQCYFCDNCQNPKDSIVVDCNPYNLDVHYSCQVFIH